MNDTFLMEVGDTGTFLRLWNVCKYGVSHACEQSEQ